ncbi:MAG: hypothetical protein ABR529_00730 [Actinomycetota bacterium]
MGTLQHVRRQKPRHDRDEQLRWAHKRAFDKISEARTTDNHLAAVKDAVQELIDACEAYTDHDRVAG